MMGWVDETGGHGLFLRNSEMISRGGGSNTQSVVVIFCCLVT